MPSSCCSVDDAKQGPDGKTHADLEPRLQLIPRPVIHADLAAPAALAAADEDGASRSVKVTLGEVKRLADSQTGRELPAAPAGEHRQAITRRAHDCDDLLDRRRIGRIAKALVPGGLPLVVARHRGGRATMTSSIENYRFHVPSSLVVDRTCRSSRSRCRTEDSNASFRITISVWRFTTRRASTASPSRTSPRHRPCPRDRRRWRRPRPVVAHRAGSRRQPARGGRLDRGRGTADRDPRNANARQVRKAARRMTQPPARPPSHELWSADHRPGHRRPRRRSGGRLRHSCANRQAQQARTARDRQRTSQRRVSPARP